jgi:hypothetical protein
VPFAAANADIDNSGKEDNTLTPSIVITNSFTPK